MKIVLVCYEFCYSKFSGNGVLAASLVSSLLRLNCQVTVWCCRPYSADDIDDNDEVQTYAENNNLNETQQQNLTVLATTLSEEAGWKRLDAESGWKEFVVDSLSPAQEQSLAEALEHVDAVAMIDWTGASACRSFLSSSSSFAQTNNRKVPNLPILYLNFRVYSSGVKDANQHQWYDDMECQALKMADAVVALSEKDRQSLKTLMEQASSPVGSKCGEVIVLLPCLRGDMEAIATQSTEALQQHLPPKVTSCLANSSTQRRLVCCVVRLSPEKDTMRFVTFCRMFRGWMQKQGYLPLIAGACSDKSYSQEVKEALKAACPDAIILDSFLSPQALAAIFFRSVINFHPCAYEAYGMTIVEAAAMGTPSIVNGGGQVGATALLPADASIHVMFEPGSSEISENTRQQLAKTLDDQHVLGIMGQKAKTCALGWDEAAYGKALLSELWAICETRGM